MKQRNETSRKFSGFLESGTYFTGDLHFEGTLRVDGTIEGSISTPDVLIVGPSALIRANVRAGSVQVHGHVVGDVSCTRRLELCSEGRVEGNIATPQLVIEDGATFDGMSQMTDSYQTVIDGPAEVVGPAEVIEPAEVGGSAQDTEPIFSTAPDDSPDEERAGSPKPEPTRWQNLVRHLGSAGLTTPSSAPSDAE